MNQGSHQNSYLQAGRNSPSVRPWTPPRPQSPGVRQQGLPLACRPGGGALRPASWVPGGGPVARRLCRPDLPMGQDPQRLATLHDPKEARDPHQPRERRF